MLASLSWEHFVLAFLGALCFEVFKIYELKQKKSQEELEEILKSFLFYFVILITSLASGTVICIFTASTGCTALPLFTIFIMGAMAKPIFIKALETYSAKMGLKQNTEIAGDAENEPLSINTQYYGEMGGLPKSPMFRKHKVTLTDIYG